MDKKFEKPYDPNQTEDKIYKLWEESGFFNPDVCVEKGICKKDADTFSMVLPPPNETGILHIGHAAMLAIEDIMVRFNRMLGKKTLWLPGTDHAAIATNTKVEKELSKKKINKHDIGRDAFLEEVKKFTENSRGEILSQTRKMGSSLDWSRLAYTLDDDRELAVNTAFKKMYDLGLIYRGHRIVNWDPKGQTVISDDEVVRKESTGKFYYLKYGPFTIATARPETKFADKYIVVHPDDKRYDKYEHMQEFEVQWINGPIKATLLKDEAGDPDIGTGAMTITPWHSHIDFEIAEKYDLPREQIIDQYGKLLPVAGEFEGMKIKDAREKIVAKLQEKGLVEKIDENHEHNLATAERTGAEIEPQIMEQWFIDVNKKFPIPHSEIEGIKAGQEVALKELMLHVVREGYIKILPKRFEKIYYHWVENLRDWNISRQIWFGHRVPVWYKGEEIHVDTTPPAGDGWEQDPDTLDTWFSSGLWTFSTLGWPNETDDLKTYHPTDVLETGYDILFFWVARMILMSTCLTGQIPFRTVYLHGLVRDGKGQKISKSLGNNIDPVETTKQHGTDALRMSLIVGVGPGADNNLSNDKIKAYKKFANKLWNIARFVLENTSDIQYNDVFDAYTEADENLRSDQDALLVDVTKDIEHYRLYLAAEKLYHYTWHTFADEILEESKKVFESGDNGAIISRKQFLMHTLTKLLVALHPFMPFITEEIWQSLPEKETDILMVANWPTKT